MNQDTYENNPRWHRELGPLQGELRVSRLVIWTVGFAGSIFALAAGFFFLAAILTVDLQLVLVGLFVSLFVLPWWILFRWIRRNEIACYERGVEMYSLLRKHTLRFEDMASFSSVIRRERARRSTSTGSQAYYYDVAYLDFLPRDSQQPELHYRTSWYPRDKRLMKIIEVCTKRMASREG